jgi:DnaA family protein
MVHQILLPVQLPDGETFETFHSAENQQVLSHLNQIVNDKSAENLPFMSYLYGEQGSGKSHLLFALCHEAQLHEISHIYIGLKQIQDLSVHMLLGLEELQLVCIDDIDQIQGNYDWQVGVFDLINRVRENGISQLVVTANYSPSQLPVTLPDLHSRLAWGITFAVNTLPQEERVKALIKRAEHRSMHMPEEVANFLLTHVPRDMTNLISVLDALDALSLQEKRKLTIPFVKSALNI